MSYTIRLQRHEMDALAWIADRYTSAEILWDGSDYDEETSILTVPEHVAWEYRDALPEDNGDPGATLPPCAGGSLAVALLAFLEGIV